MRLAVACHDDPSAFASLEAEWTALAERLRPKVPFQSWHWNEAWWRHFAVDAPALRDRLRLYTVRDAEGRLRLLAPMVLSERPARGPLRARYLHFIGADPNLTELRGPLVEPGDARDACAALLGHLDGVGRTWDWLEFSGVPWGGGAEKALETRGRLRWTREIPDFVVPLGTSWEALRASRGRNLKESLRKCYNSLKREGLSSALRVVEAPEEMGPALGRFFELHRARAHADHGPHHRDVFATDRARSFVLDYVAGAARRGEAKVFELTIDGQVVAARLGFVLGDALYLYFTGFLPEFGRFSVMTTATAEALRWAIDRGLKVANLSPGRDVSKTRWGPEELLFREAVLASRLRPGAWKQEAFVRARALSERRDGGVLGLVLRLGGRASH